MSRRSGKKFKKVQARRMVRRELKQDDTITKLGNSIYRHNYGDGIQHGSFSPLPGYYSQDEEQIVYNLLVDELEDL